MKKIYLPKLDRISINNYSLYIQEPNFDFKFTEGISAIVGVNGIGKTTFVEMIMYCIVGHKKKYNDKLRKNSKKKKIEFDNEDFFKDRMKKSFNKNDEASVQLNFYINEQYISIKRSLYENNILYLNVDGQTIDSVNEEYYQNLLTKLTGISHFKYIEKIIRNFLFFDELRENIAWEAEAQDEILRILLFDEEFFELFTELEDEVTKWDTIGRHTSEDRRVVINSYEELINEKKDLLNDIKENNLDLESIKTGQEKKSEDLNQLQQKKNEIEDEKQEIQIELENKLDIYKQNEEKLSRLIGDRDSILLSIEEIDENISMLEAKLYSAIYDKLPDFYVVLERTLCNNGECLICGSRNKEIKENSLQITKDSKCLVCCSELKVNENTSPEIIDELNELNTKKSEFNIILSNKLKEISIVESKVCIINDEIKSLNIMLNNKKYEIMNLQSLISKYNSNNDTDMLTEILKAKQKTIDELTEKVKDAYRIRDEKKKELKNLHNKFRKIIKQLNNSLSQYFNKYASTFLGLKCELTVKEQTIKKIPHIIYIPVINYEVRNDIWAVSESQRFFIDQAFRMAIIDYLQDNIDGFETFFITETPEGSLDIAYETKVAEMFMKFSKSKNNIIFTSNLNSSQFLLQLFKSIPQGRKKDKILNLLEKGDITRVQKDSISTLNKIYKDVLWGD